MFRSCSKTACPRSAGVSAAFDYAERLVWLAPLARERDPNLYDLCDEHAVTLRPPKGWVLQDRRPAAEQPTLLG